jgi:hypothetical protein
MAFGRSFPLKMYGCSDVRMLEKNGNMIGLVAGLVY